jgi:hypothetical protein
MKVLAGTSAFALVAALSGCADRADSASLRQIGRLAVHVRVGQRLAIGSVAFDAPRRFPVLYAHLLAETQKAAADWMATDENKVVDFVLVPHEDASPLALYDYVDGAFGFSASEANRTTEQITSLETSLTQQLTTKLRSDGVLWVTVKCNAQMEGSPGGFGKREGEMRRFAIQWTAHLRDRYGKTIWSPGLNALLEKGVIATDSLAFGKWASERWQTNVGTGYAKTSYSVELDQKAVARFGSTATPGEASKLFARVLQSIATAKGL